mgnify:CR=1 FL=1
MIGPITSGISAGSSSDAIGWPWRFVKANARDYRKSELFANLHRAMPSDMPILTAHMWNCMGAVAGGMTNVVDMMFDNWPMAFQLTEGATHAVQSPSGYYGFRIMNQFDEQDRLLEPTPADAIEYVGHHVDHELVENIEVDCAARLARMNAGEPRRSAPPREERSARDGGAGEPRVQADEGDRLGDAPQGEAGLLPAQGVLQEVEDGDPRKRGERG